VDEDRFFGELRVALGHANEGGGDALDDEIKRMKAQRLRLDRHQRSTKSD